MLRPHGKAFVDQTDPRAFAICDRCGVLWNHYALQPEYEWAGTKLQDKGILVCSRCMNEPAPFLRTRILPPDPEPIKHARPQNFDDAETDYRVTQIDDTRITEDDNPRIVDGR